MPKKKVDREIVITAIERGEIEMCILGATPVILHALGPKGRGEILEPSPKKRGAARQVSLKHNVLEEFRQSVYVNRETDETHLCLRGAMFKAATASIPLDVPHMGTSKAQLSRLLYCPQEMVPLYGIPQMMMSVVRNSDMARTPDIRTRAIVPQWACTIRMRFVKPVIREHDVVELVSQAGFIRGVSDWRPEKGSGHYGTFQVVNPDDKEFKSIIKSGGKKAQIKAMENPEPYDQDTETLYEWYLQRLKERGIDVQCEK